MFKIGDKVTNLHHGKPGFVGTIVGFEHDGRLAMVEFPARNPYDAIMALYSLALLLPYKDGVERAHDRINTCKKKNLLKPLKKRQPKN